MSRYQVPNSHLIGITPRLRVIVPLIGCFSYQLNEYLVIRGDNGESNGESHNLKPG